MSIPEIDPVTLTEKMQFRVTPELKKAVKHIAVEALTNDQNAANHLLQLGVAGYAKAHSGEQRTRRAS